MFGVFSLTINLSNSETLALKFKDVLALKYNLKGWFDGEQIFLLAHLAVSQFCLVDNLSRITLEKLSEGVALSCCILLILNDESTYSLHFDSIEIC